MKSSASFYHHDLRKHGFAKLDWGTSSCVLTVGPSQTKTMSTKSPKMTKNTLKHIFYLFRFELFFQNLQKEKRGRWIVQTASFVSSLYLCKHGFAKLDWGTSSCVLIVGPSQTKPMSTKNPEITKIQVKAHWFYLFRFVFQNLQREKRERWILKTASFISSIYLWNHGFAMLDWGTSSCVLGLGASQTKIMLTKNPETQQFRLKTYWVYLFRFDL